MDTKRTSNHTWHLCLRTILCLFYFSFLSKAVSPSNYAQDSTNTNNNENHINVNNIELDANNNPKNTTNAAPLTTRLLATTTLQTTAPAPDTTRIESTSATTNNNNNNNNNEFSTTATIESLIEFCSNLTSCDTCMASESSYNINCKWIQYDYNHSMSTSTDNINNLIKNNPNINTNSLSYCTHVTECENPMNDNYHCCNHSYCCDCLEQDSCIMCGAQGLNSSCTWDHTVGECFEEPTCIGSKDKCLNNPLLTKCEYPSSMCAFYFSSDGTTLWTLVYMGMIIFFICLPCCLYHKCGVDWETEFSIPINDEYALQQGDGYVFKGGAHITGRCMYCSFLWIGCIFATLAVFGTILSISCMAESY